MFEINSVKHNIIIIYIVIISYFDGFGCVLVALLSFIPGFISLIILTLIFLDGLTSKCAFGTTSRSDDFPVMEESQQKKD